MRKILALALIAALAIACTGYAETLFSSDPDATEQKAQSVLLLEVFDSDGELLCTGSCFVDFNNRTIITNDTDGTIFTVNENDIDYVY